ncbi:polysaccharide chain length determinant protein, PEP-CTERM locus family protein [delta proteobacterium NaphS2]|nr:polysaccharide chain length determinant protein, PEP-CTERM locus family protein [delta proteobacterium NaphS2]
MAENINIQDIKGIIRRRRKGFLFTFLAVFVAAVVVAFVLPPVYLSQSTILIEEQQIPDEYVKSTITSYVEERLQGITQRIMSRTRLLEIMNQFNLYPEMRDRYTTEDILDKMRNDIKLETISADVIDRRTGRPGTATIAFSLSYQGKNPGTTQKVANVLTSLYLEENLKAREQRASNTTEFLEKEQKNIKTRIDTLESNLSRFKIAHAGELPENNALNTQAVTRMERDLDQLNTQLRSLQERKIYLKGQLAVVEPFEKLEEKEDPELQKRMYLEKKRLELIALKTSLSEKHPDIKRLKKEIQELEAEVGADGDSEVRARSIAALENELAEKKGRLGPKHPDVVSLSKKLTAVKKNSDTRGDKQSEKARQRKVPDNPAYINLMTQVATTDMELKSLMEEERGLKERLRAYQERLEKAPAVEQEYLNLISNRDTAKAMYNDISTKLMEARVSQGMEEAQQGERFTITDPAQLPEKPFKPNRLAIILIGFVLGLGAGVGVGAIGESLDGSVKSGAELRRVMDVPLFSVIPLMETERERRIRWMKRAFWCVLVLVIIGVGLILVNAYVMPLDILWIKIQRRLMMMNPTMAGAGYRFLVTG